MKYFQPKNNLNYLQGISLLILIFAVSNVCSAQQQRSYHEKAEFMRHHPCPSTGKVKVKSGCKGYVIDHIDPLACGGEDKSYNMQWQTIGEAKEKDKWEHKDCRHYQ